MARKPKLGLPLQTLRNAPDALEGRRLRGGIQEIDPDQILTDGRINDRLEIEVEGLKTSISAHGQRVPILVRPTDEDQYRLIYGRRRIEACRALGIKVRAIVAESDDEHALRDQLLENQERVDLSFIERALVANALLEGDHLDQVERSHRGVAEVLGVHEASVSQLLGVLRAVGEELIGAIGPAPGIGRPRWEELKKALSQNSVDREGLIEVARSCMADTSTPKSERSDKTFMQVLSCAKQSSKRLSTSTGPKATLKIPGVGSASMSTGRSGKRLKLDLESDDKDFICWIEANAAQLIADLHERWKLSED